MKYVMFVNLNGSMICSLFHQMIFQTQEFEHFKLKENFDSYLIKPDTRSLKKKQWFTREHVLQD